MDVQLSATFILIPAGDIRGFPPPPFFPSLPNISDCSPKINVFWSFFYYICLILFPIQPWRRIFSLSLCVSLVHPISPANMVRFSCRHNRQLRTIHNPEEVQMANYISCFINMACIAAFCCCGKS